MSNFNSYTINYRGAQSKSKKGKSFLVKFLTAVAVILILSTLFISLFSFISFGENNSDFIKHQIEKGESLWTIASQYYDTSNVDLRKIVYKIKKLNNINSSVITPGKEILIPAQ